MIPRYLVNFDARELEKRHFDLLVIGSGIAGLTAALQFCKQFSVALVTKNELKESSTWYAQGGIATVMSKDDSPMLHFEDTLEAGAGLCDPEAVRVLVTEGPKRIHELMDLGAHFDRAAGDEIQLSREGGHSLPRIIHSGDATGSEVEKTLIEAAKKCPRISIEENAFAIDLITDKSGCIGGIVLPSEADKPVIFLARAVVLATGGLGQIFGVTTNPSIATGDGIAMAFRAGAEVSDMEFIQFHPTALDISESPRFLITEALRGFGAYLRDCSGERFMLGAHPQEELAPRYAVVREMMKAMERCNESHVYLDATGHSRDELIKEFPHIYEHCKEFGYDLSKDLVPVAPAAHYLMGGVKTDTLGRTSIPGLFASGEVACTGVHGANRLASNSLLEGLVFSRRMQKELQKTLDRETNGFDGDDLHYEAKKSDGHTETQPERKALTRTMFKDAGVRRSGSSLEHARSLLLREGRILEEQYDSAEGYELQNMITVAYLIVKAALMRAESRGTHFREDFPDVDDKNWRKHIVLKLKSGE
jgi:L-aspartate oxidase